MIIVWGFRFIGKKMSEGTFFCPNCRADRGYVLKAMRRWFTLFWIPLFPAGKPAGEHVICGTCKKHFTPAVLNTPTTAALSDGLKVATRVGVAAMVAASGPGDPAVRRRAMETVTASGTELYADAELDGDVGALQPQHVQSFIAPLATALDQRGRERFLQQVIGVAGGPLDDRQTATVQTLGAALGLTPAHVAGIVSTVGQPAQTAQPAAATITAPAAAWYPDPSGAPGERWWDGVGWTEHTRALPAPGTAAPGAG